MAIKIKLEKNGFIKDGFVGYSYTSVFFNIWVPAFRLDFNAFVIFFGIYIFIQFFPTFLNIYMILNLYRSQNVETIYLIRLGLWIIPLTMGAWYNRYYTKKMLKEGWKPLENDEYSNAILKGYHYLDYTDAEIRDEDKIQRYKSFIKKASGIERKKSLSFIAFIIVVILTLFYVTF